MLKPIREIIKNQSANGFPIDAIFQHFKGSKRALQFTDDEIENLLQSKYGHSDTIVILSVLYPWADLRHNFHVDHMFPKSEFTRKKLLARGLSEDKISCFIENCNFIGNLQLLEQIPNIEKNAMEFEKWLDQKVPAGELVDYKKKHYVPAVNLGFNNFDIFLEERKKLLIQQLNNELRK